MEILFIIGAVLVGVGLLKLAYFVWLSVRYPEPMLADEVHSVITEDTWPIRLYRHKSKLGEGEPVFLCHALATNHLNYELPAGKSLVSALTEAGYDCWTIDLRGNRNTPPPKGMSRRNTHVDDYLTKDVPAALSFILEKTGYDQLHWIGHSMGGMLFYAYQATLGNEHIASATTFGSPIGFKGTHVQDGAAIAWLAKTCPPLLSAVIRGAAPWAEWFKPQMPGLPINWSNMHPDLGARDYYNLLEVPPGGVAVDMNRWAIKRDWSMRNGELDVPAKLREGDTPLLAFFAPSDPFVKLPDAEDFMDNLPIDDKAMVVLSVEEGCANDYNHCDIPFSPNADIEVFVHVVEWLQEHPISTKPAAPKRSSRVASAAKLAADALGLDVSVPTTAKSNGEPIEIDVPTMKRTGKTPSKKKAAAKPKTKSVAKRKTASKASPKSSTKKKAAKAKSKTKASPKKKAAAKKPKAKKSK